MSDSDEDSDAPGDVVLISSAEVMQAIPDDHTSSSSSSPSGQSSSSDEPHPQPHQLVSADPEPSLRSRYSAPSNTPSPVPHAIPTPPPMSPARSARPTSLSPSPVISRRPASQTQGSPPKRPSPARPVAAMLSQRSSDENTCSICLEGWTSGGEHHLCCLPCGHLFGYHCIKTWLQSNRRGRCPTCKIPARVRDLRYIFGVPARLAVVDTTDLEYTRKRLREETESHERTKVRLRELRKVTDMALEEVADLRRRAANPTPSFGGVAGSIRNETRADGPSLLANCATNGGTAAVSFDCNGGVLYGEKVARAVMRPAQRVSRLDIGRCSVAESTRVASQRRVNAISVCTDETSHSFRCVAVAAGERRLKILAPGLTVAADVECDGVPLTTSWLRWKPNWLVVGTVDGRMLTFDVRHLGMGAVYTSEVTRGGARAVHSVRECVVDGESVVVAGTAGGVFGMSYDGYLNVPTVREITGARENEACICGVSINDGLIAVSSRRMGDESRRGCIAVYEGLKRGEDGALMVGDSLGEPLQGHMQALPFGEVGVLSYSEEGSQPLVAAGDANAKGGVRMWCTENARGDVSWATYEVGADAGGEGEVVRATAALRLPSRARLGRVPTGTEGLFACVSNANIRLFGAGCYL